jgi:ketosteroid isomerase-like protein
MRICYALCFLLALSLPARAGDIDFKHEVETIASTYVESFNKQDAAGIAALYTADGFHINPAGPRPDVAEFYQALFKTGFNHEEATVDQAWPLGADTAIAMGEYHITGKKENGDPLEIIGRWTAAYVTEGGKLKIRMLSAFPKAPPPKQPS